MCGSMEGGMNSPTLIRFGQKTLELHVRSGAVVDNQQRSETSVYGGGSSSVSGYGGESSSIHSRIDRYQRIFIRDSAGSERTVDPENFEAPCRIGNYVSCLAIIG